MDELMLTRRMFGLAALGLAALISTAPVPALAAEKVTAKIIKAGPN